MRTPAITGLECLHLHGCFTLLAERKQVEFQSTVLVSHFLQCLPLCSFCNEASANQSTKPVAAIQKPSQSAAPTSNTDVNHDWMQFLSAPSASLSPELMLDESFSSLLELVSSPLSLLSTARKRLWRTFCEWQGPVGKSCGTLPSITRNVQWNKERSSLPKVKRQDGSKVRDTFTKPRILPRRLNTSKNVVLCYAGHEAFYPRFDSVEYIKRILPQQRKGSNTVVFTDYMFRLLNRHLNLFF